MNTSKPRHPTFEELIALTIDDLPAQRAGEVREHLLECPECLARSRELLRLPDAPPSPEQEIGEAEQAQAWQSLGAAIEAEKTRAGKAEEAARHEQASEQDRRAFTLLPGGSPGGAGFPAKSKRLWALPLAASFVAAVLGFAAGQGIFPRRDDIRAVVTTPLRPSTYYHRGEVEKPTRLECPPEDGEFGAAVSFPSGKTPQIVFFEIRSAAGKVIAAERSYPVGPKGELQISVPRSRFSDGQYVIHVRRETRAAPIEEYPFSVDCSP